MMFSCPSSTLISHPIVHGNTIRPLVQVGSWRALRARRLAAACSLRRSSHASSGEHPLAICRMQRRKYSSIRWWRSSTCQSLRPAAAAR